MQCTILLAGEAGTKKSMHGPPSIKHSGQTKWPSASIIKEEKGNWLSGHKLLLKEQLRYERSRKN